MYLARMMAASRDVYPRGVMVLGLEAAIDFDARQRGEDRQLRDEKTGWPTWNLTGLDVRGLDPQERATGEFRGTPEVKVKVLSETEPELPRPQMEGMGRWWSLRS
jgi:hypothetical protein